MSPSLQLAERLKLCDPLLLEMPEQDQALEPEWLLQLRAHCQHWEVRSSPGVLQVSSLLVVLCPSGFPFCPLAAGQRATGVLVWGSPLIELVLSFTLSAWCTWALPCATLSSSLSRLSSGSLQTEDDLTPEVAPTQPELSWAAASTPGMEGEQRLLGLHLKGCLPNYLTGPNYLCGWGGCRWHTSVGHPIEEKPSRVAPWWCPTATSIRRMFAGHGCLLLATCSYPVFWR